MVVTKGEIWQTYPARLTSPSRTSHPLRKALSRTQKPKEIYASNSLIGCDRKQTEATWQYVINLQEHYVRC